MNNTSEINENIDFKQCNTNTEALHSRAANDFIDAFARLNFPHEKVLEINVAFEKMLSCENVTDEELLLLESLIESDDIADIEERGDYYIENNLKKIETTDKCNITAKNIIKIYKLYLAQLKVNKNVYATLSLCEEDINLDTDEHEVIEQIVNNEDCYIYSVGEKLFRVDKKNPDNFEEFESFEVIKGKIIKPKTKKVTKTVSFFTYQIEENEYEGAKEIITPSVIIVNDGKYKGLLDGEGNIILPSNNTDIHVFGEYVHIEKGENNGLFSLKTGKNLINCNYEDLSLIDLAINLIHVKQGGKWGVYHTDNFNQYLLSPEFDEIPKYYGTHFECTKNNKIGGYNLYGIEVVPCAYKSGIEFLGDNFFLVENEKGFGIYKAGSFNDEIIKCSRGFKSIEYIKGVGFIVNDGKEKRVIGLNGENILPKENSEPGFLHIEYDDYFSGFFVKDLDDNIGLYNLSGDVVFECSKYNKYFWSDALYVGMTRSIWLPNKKKLITNINP